MANAGLGQELLGLERRYWQAIQEKDVKTAMSLTDETCIVAGAHGVAAFDRTSFEKMMTSATYEVQGFKLDDDCQVLQLTDDVAVLAYKVHEDLVVDGKKLSLDAADASTWIRRNGQWVCALHTESLQGDPYGRDRVKT
jgi:hypothetical protein